MFIFTIPAILAALGVIGSSSSGNAAITKAAIGAKNNKAEQSYHNEIIGTSNLAQKY